MRIDVVHRHGVWGIEAEQNNVGFLARFKRANFLFHMQGPRALDGGHLDDGFRAQRSRVDFGDLLQLRREVHFFHQVQIIVAACWAVRAEADGYAGGSLLDHGGNAASQHHVA